MGSVQDGAWRRWGSARLQLEGLGLEKLLTRATVQGIRLRQVARRDIRTLRATVRMADLPALQALAQGAGWRLTVLGHSTLGRAQGLLTRRVMLACGCAVFLVCVAAAMQCVWFVRIQGADESAAEVRVVLRAFGAVPGRLKAGLDLPAIQRALERRLPRVAWVRARLEGVTLVVDCVPARVAVPAQYGGEAGDVVASRDGVVSQITVYAGVARVKPGDAVRRGQVLVAGQERGADEALRPVAAHASVRAKVWYSGKAVIPATESRGQPTGGEVSATCVATPWFRWPVPSPPVFAHWDVSLTRQRVGGLFLPLWLETARYEEVNLIYIPRDIEALRRESAEAAERLARQSVPFHAQILDKWVEYSMIKEEHFAAEVILEAEEEIAAPLGTIEPSARQEAGY
ncbi:MAG: sporulation protein YqfD [Oscillospiraceae bacterium]|jgi:similar to stage IV sporulation protein|nr:sporulation protein YqfD [Oscillospiraceae bacterium]